MNVLRAISRPFKNHVGLAVQYELLSNGGHDHDLDYEPSSHHRRGCTPQRRRLFNLKNLFLLLGTVFALLIGGILASGIPPDFARVREIEKTVLPLYTNVVEAQHHHVKYLKFQKSLTGKGLNNFLQEVILKSYLAHSTNRSYVYEDYIWSHLPLPYTLYDFALRPTRMPLNAFVAGPTAGAPVYAPDGSVDLSVPRGVTDAFYQKVCPPETRRVISSKDEPAEAEGNVIIDWWKGQLEGVEEECVEISDETTVFDYNLFDSERVHSVWPGLSSSPVIKQFTWSPLVQSALIRNTYLFSSPSTNTSLARGTLAVHLRRGDFKRHCTRLNNWDVPYMGFNSFPGLLDRFSAPPWWDDARKAERARYYTEHCLPEVEQIVARLHAVREAHPGVGRVYILTNGWGWWVDEVARALRADAWGEVSSTLDLVLDAEQRWVANAVDMAIAERAEVFVGNGFSSLSANIVMLRLGRGMEFASNRFL